MRQNNDMCVCVFRPTMLRVTSPERQEERVRWTQTGRLTRETGDVKGGEEMQRGRENSDGQDGSKRKLKMRIKRDVSGPSRRLSFGSTFL